MISKFDGQYRFLSNFFPAKICWEEIVYPTSEHAYQAAKSVDIACRVSISKLSTPGQAKRAGKTISLREDWELIKLNIMEDIVRAKFTQNSFLANKLLETYGHELIEGNNWKDHFWGVCNGVGNNHLGKILMKIREELYLKKERSYEN